MLPWGSAALSIGRCGIGSFPDYLLWLLWPRYRVIYRVDGGIDDSLRQRQSVLVTLLLDPCTLLGRQYLVDVAVVRLDQLHVFRMEFLRCRSCFTDTKGQCHKQQVLSLGAWHRRRMCRMYLLCRCSPTSSVLIHSIWRAVLSRTHKALEKVLLLSVLLLRTFRSLGMGWGLLLAGSMTAWSSMGSSSPSRSCA